MSKIMITADAAKRVLRPMIVSCGTAGCFEAVQRLESVTKTVSLSSVGMDNEGHWLMAAFSRLKDFAIEENLSTLDVFDIARYFGGKMHIGIMARIADHAGMGQYLGPYAGLVSHVLMPLNDGFYINGNTKVDFNGNFIELNPQEPGVSCYHLGVVVNIPLTENQVETILQEQSESEEFMNAVKKLKGPIIPPKEYWDALSCTVAKATP